MVTAPDLLPNLRRNHGLIRENVNRVADLAEDFVIFSRVQNKSGELSPCQFKLINERRITLRQTIRILQGGLLKHYERVEKVMQPALSDPLMKAVWTKHREMLGKLYEIDGLLLNLSPTGILLNGPRLKQKIEVLCQSIGSHSEVEDSLLELIGIYSS